MPTSKLRTLSAGVLGAAVLTGVGVLTPAVAYPPGTGIAVSATAKSAASTVLSVLVSQAKPGCSVAVTAKAGSATASGQTVVGSNGTAAFTLSLPRVQAAKARVTATTVGTCSYKEKASTTVDIKTVLVRVPGPVQPRESFYAQGYHFLPGSTVTFTARKGGTTIVHKAVANAQGFARASFVLPTKGTWVLTGASQGRSDSTTVVVG